MSLSFKDNVLYLKLPFCPKRHGLNVQHMFLCIEYDMKSGSGESIEIGFAIQKQCLKGEYTKLF